MKKGNVSFKRCLFTVMAVFLMLFIVLPVSRPASHTAFAAGMSAKTYKKLKLKGWWRESKGGGLYVKFSRTKVSYYTSRRKKKPSYTQKIVKVKRINKLIGGYRTKGYVILLKNNMKSAKGQKNLYLIEDSDRRFAQKFSGTWNPTPDSFVQGTSLEKK